jgi:hypothetical protein
MSGASMLAAIANTPELEMSADQAAKIQSATLELAKLYPIGMSEKTLAWCNFSLAVGGWAGPGVIAWWRHPPPPKPQRVPTPIREATGTSEAVPAPGQAIQGLPTVGPGTHGPDAAQVPSQMWSQPGDIADED